MADGKKKKRTAKVTMTADMDSNTVKVTYGKSVQGMDQATRQLHLNITLAGVDGSLKKLLGPLPQLRVATDEEREAKIYVFADQSENDLYKGREQLHRTIADVFQNTLQDLFPDVIYVDECRKYQQETIFDMSSEEATEYQKEIEAITDSVKEKLEKGDSDDGDSNTGEEGTITS